MNSKAAASFWKCHDELPAQVQKLALKNFRLWLGNSDYPSLHFKPFKKNFWSVRVGDHYRAVGYYRDSQTFVWTWIGTHEGHFWYRFERLEMTAFTFLTRGNFFILHSCLI